MNGKDFDPEYAIPPISEENYKKWKAQIHKCSKKTEITGECLDICERNGYFNFKMPI